MEGLPTSYTLGPLPQISLFGLQIPTYHLIISLTCCLCVYWFYKRCEVRNLSQRNAMDISMIVLITGFVGARLAHVLWEYPSYYWQNPVEVFYFWQGGFVFYGGAILGYLCAFLYARRLKLTFWLWHDTAAPVLALGYALGRIACFLEGCCYGKVCTLPWAIPLKEVDVHSHAITTALRHPTQIYASLMEACTLFFLLWLEKKKAKLGVVFLSWVMLHALGRILMEIFRDDPRGPMLMGLSVSTMISLIFIGLAGMTLRARLREPH
ncbi:MAG: prolipoprotein diacylglyceryl transferase [Bdellovibrionales bacterium]|nr:prolipoprotein diacylglyceryl transferase [Bdellovibrionales bacterium]